MQRIFRYRDDNKQNLRLERDAPKEVTEMSSKHSVVGRGWTISNVLSHFCDKHRLPCSKGYDILGEEPWKGYNNRGDAISGIEVKIHIVGWAKNSYIALHLYQHPLYKIWAATNKIKVFFGSKPLLFYFTEEIFLVEPIFTADENTEEENFKVEYLFKPAR